MLHLRSRIMEVAVSGAYAGGVARVQVDKVGRGGRPIWPSLQYLLWIEEGIAARLRSTLRRACDSGGQGCARPVLLPPLRLPAFPAMSRRAAPRTGKPPLPPAKRHCRPLRQSPADETRPRLAARSPRAPAGSGARRPPSTGPYHSPKWVEHNGRKG